MIPSTTSFLLFIRPAPSSLLSPLLSSSASLLSLHSLISSFLLPSFLFPATSLSLFLDPIARFGRNQVEKGRREIAGKGEEKGKGGKKRKEKEGRWEEREG